MSGTRRRGQAKYEKNDIDNPPQVVVNAAKKKPRYLSQNKWLLLMIGLALTASVYYSPIGRIFESGLEHSNAGVTVSSEPPIGPQVISDSDPFIVVDVPGRGKGLVATRDIEQGERIITEKPLFIAPDHVVGSAAALIAKHLREISPEDRAAFLDLSYVNFPKHLDPATHPEEVALAIFQTNAVAAGTGVGIFPRMARLNHGCSSAFNAVYSWREKEEILVVHALKKIIQGEEILTTYTDTKRPRAERRAFLQQNYGFTCMCRACSLSDKESQASDERLLGISEAYTRFATWGQKNITGIEAIELSKTIWALEDEEGYWSERGRLAADTAYVAAAHSDATSTREWAKIALTWYGYELGKDSEHVLEMSGVVTHPQSHPGWGSRDAQEVGGPET